METAVRREVKKALWDLKMYIKLIMPPISSREVKVIPKG